jgi:hypothetical protein
MLRPLLKKQLPVALLPMFFFGCAHLPGREPPRPSEQLWNDAHFALYAEEFSAADSLFTRLAASEPDTDHGREARFFLGALHLDPRNQNWNPERAETALREYLSEDTISPVIHRRPEARTLLGLAVQLNLPPDERVSALQPTVPTVQPRVVVPAGQQREAAEENERLRRLLAERDDQIRRQREELERIRGTLAPRTP